MEWENGEITEEPLAIIAADDPVTCAIYAILIKKDRNALKGLLIERNTSFNWSSR
jgi:hypothetical protein